MYSRSYRDDGNGRPLPPPNYDGTAFMNDKIDEKIDTGGGVEENASNSETQAPETAEAFSGLGSILPKSLLGLFSGGGIRLPKIGVEEILIIATALFLFFSGDGDKECAVLLLLLLLVN